MLSTIVGYVKGKTMPTTKKTKIDTFYYGVLQSHHPSSSLGRHHVDRLFEWRVPNYSDDTECDSLSSWGG